MAKPTLAKVNDIAQQTKEAVERADLFEARARIALAQAEISRAHFERVRYMTELADLEKRNKSK